MQVKMRVIRPIMYEDKKDQIVVLKETDGRRQFPVLIRSSRVASISRRLKKRLDSELPEHRGLRLVIERAVIADLQARSLSAFVSVRRNGQVRQIDCQPSDALALALADNIPIYVEEDILKALAW